MLPKTDTRDRGLRDRLRVVYYHFREAGTFPTPSQGSGAVRASENLVLRHERAKSGDRVGGEDTQGTGKKREHGCYPGWSERGCRSGREWPEKEKWFNYASGGEDQ